MTTHDTGHNGAYTIRTLVRLHAADVICALSAFRKFDLPAPRTLASLVRGCVQLAGRLGGAEALREGDALVELERVGLLDKGEDRMVARLKALEFETVEDFGLFEAALAAARVEVETEPGSGPK